MRSVSVGCNGARSRRRRQHREASPTLRRFPVIQMARTQKNKATMGHLGMLKVRKMGRFRALGVFPVP